MYERLTDKTNQPTAEEVEKYLGDSYPRLLKLEEFLRARYRLSKEMRFPFGKNYGWGYKYSDKSAHLCHAFFEKGAFTATLQIGVADIPALSAKGEGLWANRYPCGHHGGGWVHYQVLAEEDLSDIFILIETKKKPGNV